MIDIENEQKKVIFTRKVVRNGPTLVISIPPELVNFLEIKEGDYLSFEGEVIDVERVILKKSEKNE